MHLSFITIYHLFTKKSVQLKSLLNTDTIKGRTNTRNNNVNGKRHCTCKGDLHISTNCI